MTVDLPPWELPPDPEPSRDVAHRAPTTLEPRPAPADPTDPTETLWDEQAETSVLGGMMLQPAVIDPITEVITGRDYWRPGHELIHDAIVALHSSGDPADMVTVARKLGADLARAGGPAYLHTLVSGTPTAANAPYYARIVAEHAVRRRLRAAGVRLQQAAGTDTDVTALVEAAVQDVHAAAEGATVATGVTLATAVEELIDTLDEPLPGGIKWPLIDLNKLLLPMLPGQLVLVGARPSIGKTNAGLEIARHAAIYQDVPTAFLGLEQTRGEFTGRILAAESGIDARRIILHDLTAQDWARIPPLLAKIEKAPLLLDDATGVGLEEIARIIRKGINGQPIRLLIIDYAQLCRMPRAADRRLSVEAFSRGLKLLAKLLSCTIVAMVQLNRGPESRTDKKPVMSDLRETGGWEMDADTIILLHRPDFYDSDDRPGEADWIAAKHRNGEIGTVATVTQFQFARFQSKF